MRRVLLCFNEPSFPNLDVRTVGESEHSEGCLDQVLHCHLHYNRVRVGGLGFQFIETKIQ